MSLIEKSSFRPSPGEFPSPIAFDTSGTPAEGRGWLKQLTRRLPVPEYVVLSWSPEIALVTTLNLFITHWDDFCYPMSDDATILPPDLSWKILYQHEEVLCFADRRIAK
jgi:hypothetical protein